MFVLAFPAFSNENRRNTDIFLVFFQTFFNDFESIGGRTPDYPHLPQAPKARRAQLFRYKNTKTIVSHRVQPFPQKTQK